MSRPCCFNNALKIIISKHTPKYSSIKIESTHKLSWSSSVVSDPKIWNLWFRCRAARSCWVGPHAPVPSRYNTGRPSWFGDRPGNGEHRKKDRRKERWSQSNYSCPINKLWARNCTLLCIPSKANLNQQSVINKAHHDQLLVEQLRGIRQMSPANYYREYESLLWRSDICQN